MQNARARRDPAAVVTAATALISAAIAGLALLGWVLRVELLRSVVPGWISMVPDTALALLSAALSLWLLRDETAGFTRRLLGRAAALITGAIGVAALIEHGLGRQFSMSLSRLLVDESDLARGVLTQVSLNAAVGMVLLSLALLLLDLPWRHGRRFRPSEVLAAIVATTSLVATAAYAFGAPPYYGLPGRIPPTAAALNTGIALLSAAIGVLFARARRGVMGLLFEPLVGSDMVRRVLPVVFCLPLLGWVVHAGVREGYYTAPVAMALITGIGTAIGLLVILPVGHALNDTDRRRKELYDQLAAASQKQQELYREARAAVRTREELIAVVSHDLRNPLAAIHTSAKLMIDHILPALDGDAIARERAERALHTLLRASAAAQAQIADLLDFAKIEAGKLTVDLRPRRVSELFDEVLTIMNPLAESHSVHLRRAGGEDFGVQCDQQRVVQVLCNLVGNAIKFNHSNGHVIITARRGPDGWAELSVMDDGPGIGPAALEHLFERYWQPKETSRQGTGLGLSISKALVEAHGGKIWVKTKPGEGTTFSFTLKTTDELPAPELTAH